MELKKSNGQYLTQDELLEQAIEWMVDEMMCLSDEDALALSNEYRVNNSDPALEIYDEDTVNEVLDGVSPWELLNLDRGSRWDDYFTWDGWDFNTVSDVWDGIDMEEFARDILNEDFLLDRTYRELEAIKEEYEELKSKLESMNKYRRRANEVINKFKNCEADAVDLLYVLEQLVNTDDAWAEEE